MRISLPGWLISIVLIVLSLITLMMHYGLIQYREDMNDIQVAERNYVDKVIDTKDLVGLLDSLEMDLGVCSCKTSYEVTLYRQVTNPSSTGIETAFEPIYVTKQSDIECYTGDIVSIKVTPTSLNIYQVITGVLFHAMHSERPLVLSGRIR